MPKTFAPPPPDAAVPLSVAAPVLGISVKTAYRLAARDGRLAEGVPAMKVGAQWRVAASALADWLARRAAA
jgi:hypothetical protein